MKIYTDERVTLKFRVDNLNGDDFTVSDGDYSVYLDDAVVSAGKLNVADGCELSFVFSVDTAGIYKIAIWYDVDTDRRKAEFPIEVVE